MEIENLFKNQNLLLLALTHKSWVNENPNIRESNERLEFLGDAVLEFVVTEYLYKTFPSAQEGYLTALRANLVNTKNLANLAEKINLGNKIFLSKGEEECGGRKNPSLLADTVEAIIGGLYLDSGLEKVIEFIKINLLSDIPQKISRPLKDAKSRFQEGVQAQGKPAPKYRVVKENGPDHNKNFMVEVSVEEKVLGIGWGKSKSEAEQNAAENALKKTNLD